MKMQDAEMSDVYACQEIVKSENSKNHKKKVCGGAKITKSTVMFGKANGS